MASFCPLSTLAALSASAFTMIESNADADADADTNTGPTESRSPSAGPSESLQSDAARCSAACPRDDGDCGGAAEKKPRAKAGRKLTTTEPENKRIAQTRAAQRYGPHIQHTLYRRHLLTIRFVIKHTHPKQTEPFGNARSWLLNRKNNE
ncbi:hypothetical protein BCR33DRAFT_732304 [Rhizoclosmatium globosum]|uniref:Secreted protein n=1 Tax=Rhizoclosmatium globosum TaxID=329046 RepID=A0A1Y1ZG94_9FUNG|nr:hypothetical protein BCR33DRAFT_732304 [Rhizoclosmatium globosum]|eukprot:ORY09263.1 hypothetical protein BCR33DRAFT_732304 [Rhizoclosmatium globosum]